MLIGRSSLDQLSFKTNFIGLGIRFSVSSDPQGQEHNSRSESWGATSSNYPYIGQATPNRVMSIICGRPSMGIFEVELRQPILASCQSDQSHREEACHVPSIGTIASLDRGDGWQCLINPVDGPDRKVTIDRTIDLDHGVTINPARGSIIMWLMSRKCIGVEP